MPRDAKVAVISAQVPVKVARSRRIPRTRYRTRTGCGPRVSSPEQSRYYRARAGEVATGAAAGDQPRSILRSTANCNIATLWGSCRGCDAQSVHGRQKQRSDRGEGSARPLRGGRDHTSDNGRRSAREQDRGLKDRSLRAMRANSGPSPLRRDDVFAGTDLLCWRFLSRALPATGRAWCGGAPVYKTNGI